MSRLKSLQDLDALFAADVAFDDVAQGHDGFAHVMLPERRSGAAIYCSTRILAPSFKLSEVADRDAFAGGDPTRRSRCRRCRRRAAPRAARPCRRARRTPRRSAPEPCTALLGKVTPPAGCRSDSCGGDRRGTTRARPSPAGCARSFWSSAMRTVTVPLLRSAVGITAITCAGNLPVGIGIELRGRLLGGLHAVDEIFIDVDLDLERVHVDDGADAGAREAAAGGDRGNHFAGLRGLDGDDARERRPHDGVVEIALRRRSTARCDDARRCCAGWRAAPASASHVVCALSTAAWLTKCPCSRLFWRS